METVICPNCGSLIGIPKTMPVSVTCKKCSESFGVEYDYAEVGFFGKIKMKYNDFSVKHPKIIKNGKNRKCYCSCCRSSLSTPSAR